jgi:hypothetical protein
VPVAQGLIEIVDRLTMDEKLEKLKAAAGGVLTSESL